MTAGPIKPLALPNIIQLKNDYPAVHDDLVKMQEHINLVTQRLGGYTTPTALGGITVSASNGVIDISIIDKNPQQGDQYFLNYDTSPSFANAHDVPLTAVRNYRTTTLAGQTTYWRWYKSTQLGGVSDFVTYGSPPTAVTPGNISTATGGPAPAPSQGSGQSQIPGYGYSSAEGAAGRRTNIF